MSDASAAVAPAPAAAVAPAPAAAVAPAPAPADARSRATALFNFAKSGVTLDQFLEKYASLHTRSIDNVHTLLAYYSSFNKIAFDSSKVADDMIAFNSPLIKEKVESFKYGEKVASDTFKAFYVLNKDNAAIKAAAAVWEDQLRSHPHVRADAKIAAMIEKDDEPSIKDLLDALVRPPLKRCSAVYKTASSIDAKKNIHVAGAQCANTVRTDLELPDTCHAHAPKELKARAKFLKAQIDSEKASAAFKVAEASVATAATAAK